MTLVSLGSQSAERRSVQVSALKVRVTTFTCRYVILWMSLTRADVTPLEIRQPFHAVLQVRRRSDHDS
jgi:hypothetical protein